LAPNDYETSPSRSDQADRVIMIKAEAFNMNQARVRRLIERAITTFELDLKGLVVLTEAATGYYALTPLLAAMGGADKVLALARDSSYGTAQEARWQTLNVIQQWGFERHISVLMSREDDRIGEADIVTNLGAVRPLNASFLRRLKSTSVIPLMWETWEYRPEDLDLATCRRLGIPVLGTNEHHPDLQILHYVGLLAIKLLFELQIEVFRSEIVVIGGREFGTQVARTLQSAGAEVTQVRVSEGESLHMSRDREVLMTCDAVVVAEHRSREMLIGPGGQMEASELVRLNPGVVVAHIAGAVDRTSLVEAGMACLPEHIAPAGYMSVTADRLGPRPLIDLHAAGLKVGEALAQAATRGLRGLDAERYVVAHCELAQGWSEHTDLHARAAG